MPLKSWTSRETVSYNVKKLMKEWKLQDQAIAITLSNVWYKSKKK